VKKEGFFINLIGENNNSPFFEVRKEFYGVNLQTNRGFCNKPLGLLIYLEKLGEMFISKCCFLLYMLKKVKHTKEYQKELFRTPTFWGGVALIILGGIFAFLKFNLVLYLVLLIAGFFLVFTTKYRIMGRLEGKHSK
jgi:hypothetical protein